MQNGFSLPPVTASHPVTGLVAQENAMLQKEVCKDQWTIRLMYAEEEISKTKFLGINKETMDDVYKSFEELLSWGNTKHRTWSSHHLIPLSSSKIAHKLLSEDKSYAGTHDFNLPTTSNCDIRPIPHKLLSDDESYAGTHDFNLPTTFQLCDSDQWHMWHAFLVGGFGNPTWRGTKWCQSSIYVHAWAK